MARRKVAADSRSPRVQKGTLKGAFDREWRGDRRKDTVVRAPGHLALSAGYPTAWPDLSKMRADRIVDHE
jgi:hypothetical protein